MRTKQDTTAISKENFEKLKLMISDFKDFLGSFSKKNSVETEPKYMLKQLDLLINFISEVIGPLGLNDEGVSYTSQLGRLIVFNDNLQHYKRRLFSLPKRPEEYLAAFFYQIPPDRIHEGIIVEENRRVFAAYDEALENLYHDLDDYLKSKDIEYLTQESDKSNARPSSPILPIPFSSGLFHNASLRSQDNMFSSYTGLSDFSDTVSLSSTSSQSEDRSSPGPIPNQRTDNDQRYITGTDDDRIGDLDFGLLFEDEDERAPLTLI